MLFFIVIYVIFDSDSDLILFDSHLFLFDSHPYLFIVIYVIFDSHLFLFDNDLRYFW